MLCRKDYRRAGTPMLPAQCTQRRASWWVLLHTVATAATVLLMGLVPALGWLYFLPVLLASAYLLRHNVALVLQPSSARARTMFLASNLYLMLVLLAVLLATLVTQA